MEGEIPSKLQVTAVQVACIGYNIIIGTAEKMYALFVGMNKKINI